MGLNPIYPSERHTSCCNTLKFFQFNLYCNTNLHLYKMAKKQAVGIDLGTTYSCVGVFQYGKVEIIANDQGNRTTPSYVAFTDTERLIGDPAKNQVAINPTNAVFDAKRLIGRKFDDPTVQADMKHWPFTVVEEGGRPKLEVEYKNETKRFTPEECSSMVLTKMKESLLVSTSSESSTNPLLLPLPTDWTRRKDLLSVMFSSLTWEEEPSMFLS